MTDERAQTFGRDRGGLLDQDLRLVLADLRSELVGDASLPGFSGAIAPGHLQTFCTTAEDVNRLVDPVDRARSVTGGYLVNGVRLGVAGMLRLRT